MRKVWILLLFLQLLLAVYDPMQDILEQGDYAQLLTVSQASIYEEENAHNYYYLGAAYAGLGRIKTADMAYQKALAYPDYSLEMGLQIAAYYESLKDTAKVAKTYENLINKFPNDTKEVALKLGELYYNQKNYKETINIFSDFINKDESKANPLAYFVGLSYYQLQNNTKAEEYLELALKNGYEDPKLYILLGDLKIKRGDIKTGAEQMAKGLNENKEKIPADNYLTLGKAYAQLNQYTAAATTYRGAIDNGATDVDTYLAYADNASHSKNFQGVIDLMEPRAEEFAKNSEYLYYLANAYDNLGIPVQAIAYYQKALDAGYPNKEYIKGRLAELTTTNQQQ